jgi:hypothetical protein
LLPPCSFIDICPIADGGAQSTADVKLIQIIPYVCNQTDCKAQAFSGEGTVAALVAAMSGEHVPVTTTDAQGRPVEASYGWLPPATAVVEMSAASGLALVADLPLRPRSASTFGMCAPGTAAAAVTARFRCVCACVKVALVYTFKFRFLCDSRFQAPALCC